MGAMRRDRTWIGMPMKMFALAIVLAAFGGCGGCGPKDSVDTLQDPNTCMECHPKHFQQWSGSMHAYASDDPVFIAMNKRGQRDTGGALGTFCVKCHAPMALQLGLVTTANVAAFDPNTLPPKARGITCYFCHNVDSVTDDHNNGLVLALDDTMRGGARNPVDSPAHNSLFDPEMSSKTNKSAMCGSCHDVVTPAPASVPLERTFTEWKTTVFAHDDPTNMLPLTCSKCHMNPTKDVIADKPGLNVPVRDLGFHDHGFPAIDTALTAFPEIDAQKAGIDAILKPAIAVKGPVPRNPNDPQPGGICVEPVNGGRITVRIDTFGTGHMFPSGAAQDRRVWLEVTAYDVNNVVLFSSGVVPSGKDPEEINDPNLAGFWDRTVRADGMPAHFFWDVVSPVDSRLLKPPVTLIPTDLNYDHSTTAQFLVGALRPQIDHITTRMWILPIAYSVLDQLVMTGDLDAAIPSKITPLLIPGGTQKWTKATQTMFTGCNPFPSPP
jgi:hypothetical protein